VQARESADDLRVRAFGLQRPQRGVPGGGRADGFGLGRNGVRDVLELVAGIEASLATVAAVRLGGAFLASGRLGSQSGTGGAVWARREW